MRSRLLLLILAATSARGADFVLLERVLAVVNGRPVLLSNVNLLARLKNLDPKAALEAAIDERLMAEEAAQLPQATVTPEEESSGYENVLSRLHGLPDDVVEADLRLLVRREEMILKYVDFRFRSETRVTDADIKKAYDAQYSGAANAPDLSSVQDTFRQRVEDALVGEAVEAWVKELRSSADIRYQNP